MKKQKIIPGYNDVGIRIKEENQIAQEEQSTNASPVAKSMERLDASIDGLYSDLKLLEDSISPILSEDKNLKNSHTLETKKTFSAKLVDNIDNVTARTEEARAFVNTLRERVQI